MVCCCGFVFKVFEVLIAEKYTIFSHAQEQATLAMDHNASKKAAGPPPPPTLENFFSQPDAIMFPNILEKMKSFISQNGQPGVIIRRLRFYLFDRQTVPFSTHFSHIARTIKDWRRWLT